jgi:D-xylose transport system substrate-binding protein
MPGPDDGDLNRRMRQRPGDREPGQADAEARRVLLQRRDNVQVAREGLSAEVGAVRAPIVNREDAPGGGADTVRRRGRLPPERYDGLDSATSENLKPISVKQVRSEMTVRRMALLVGALVIVIVGAIALTSCGGDEGDGGAASPTAGGGGGGTIALLLPESKTARYETQDRPLFEAKVKELCPDCEVLYSNANQDATQQQSQAEAALTNGADVLVLDPVDFASAGPMVQKANDAGVPVISYDRLITDANIDYYISFDNEKVGQLQGQALLDAIDANGDSGGTIVMINGAPTDNNAAQFKAGAHSVLDGQVEIGAEFDTPDWSPDKAQTQMDQAITNLGKDGFVGVYAANDGTAGGAIAAMKGAGIDPTTIPTTGQDAEVAALQRILVDEQLVTVYKNYAEEAPLAAELAVALVTGQSPPASIELVMVNNGAKDVPSIILDPVVVNKDNIKDTVIADGLWKVSDICTGAYADACAEAGIE